MNSDDAINDLSQSEDLDDASPQSLHHTETPEEIWHYVDQSGQRMGPINEHELRSLLAAGQLHLNTLIWKDGFENWFPVSHVPEIVGVNAQLMTNQLNTQNSSALTSMILGIISLPMLLACSFFSIIIAVPAVVLGHMALKQIKYSQPMQTGRGMALTGVICGYLSSAISLVIVAFIATFFIREMP